MNKKKLRLPLTLALSFLIALCAMAQQPVQNFTLLNVADNKTISLEEFQSCSGLVVAFTSNECAYDQFYITRLRSLVDAYKGKIQFLLVNSYTEPDEAVDKMKTKYDAWGLPIPYLADKDQNAMDCLGARKSPEVFLLKNVNNKYFTFYSGAIDDNPQVASDVKQNYLKAAIENLLADKKAGMSTMRGPGCPIRRK